MAAKTFEELKGDLSRTYPGLSPQLQRIASYALEHPQHMALETVARLAKSANVQPSAMVRFAQSLGYDGFSALQQLYNTRLVERSSRDTASPPLMSEISAVDSAMIAGASPSTPVSSVSSFANLHKRACL
jgi:DNA-binding MurR/RpiR family transcriptional regulator